MSYGAPSPSQPYGAPAAGNNQKAIWSLVTGILGLVCCGLAGIAAIILAGQAEAEIRQTGQQGAGMAKAGRILGIIALVWMVIGSVLFFTGVFTFGN